MKWLRLIGFVLFALAFCSWPGLAQRAKNQWLRVNTDEESTIEVDRTSLVLEASSIIRADFRTSFTTSESVPGKPDLSFLSRIDQIQFDLKNNRYRVAESTFLNAKAEKVFASSGNSDKDWKQMAGKAAFRLRDAAAQLAPFGSWNISSYRYPLGGLPSDSDPPELRSLVGSKISILLFETVIERTTCSVRDFETFFVDEASSTQMFGSSLTDLKIPAAKVQAIRFKCVYPINAPKEAIMLLLASNKALILWDGVFLETERSGNMFLP
jgi:hypothetical protein